MKELAGCSLKKNDLFELKIEDISNDGEGIGRYEGFTFFVKDAVAGDVIRARVLKLKKNYGFARVEQVLEPSKDRTVPRCPLARQCGGCQLQHISYEKQLEYKQNKVKACLERIGGLENPVLEPILGMEVPYYYRNKAQFPVGPGRDGRPAIGFYAGRTHTIIDTEHCYIQARVNEVLIAAVREYLTEQRVPLYEEEQHTGLVRHILTRVGFTTGEIMVCIVLNGTSIPKPEVLKDKLLAAVEIYNRKSAQAAGNLKDCRTEGTAGGAGCDEKAGTELIEGADGCAVSSHGKTAVYYNDSVQPEEIYTNYELQTGAGKENGRQYGTDPVYRLMSLCFNVNQEKTNVILGNKILPYYGETYITDYIGPVKYQISPLSFYQVNPGQTLRLYEQALEYADLKGNETVWDLYCGIGTISLFLAHRARQVYGVEIVPQAIEDARKNAALNGITNAEFFVGAAEEVLPQQYVKSGGTMRADVIVVDPPRKGCEESLLATIAAMEPDRVVYVSCDPATLARDVKYLREHGYEYVKGRAVDQFGMSGHVECVVLMSRVEK